MQLKKTFMVCSIALLSYNSIFAKTKNLVLPFGDAKAQLGSIIEEVNQEVSDELVVSTQGPQSFYVDRSHNIFVLDQFKSRIVQFNQKGKAIGSFPLPYSDTEESSFEDILVLPDRSILLLDTLQSRLLKVQYGKEVKTTVTHQWNQGAQETELLFLNLESNSRAVFARDRNTGMYYQFAKEGLKPLLNQPPKETLNHSAHRSIEGGQLGFQWNPENPYDLEFFNVGQTTSKLFSIKTLRDLEGLKVLHSNQDGLELLTYKSSEEQSVIDSVLHVNWKGEIQNVLRLNLPTIPWSMSRESQFQQGFLYTAHFDSKRNGLVIRRMNLSRDAKG